MKLTRQAGLTSGDGAAPRVTEEALPSAAPPAGERMSWGPAARVCPRDHAGLAVRPAQSGHQALSAVPLPVRISLTRNPSPHIKRKKRLS
jgi:hypothetical protein